MKEVISQKVGEEVRAPDLNIVKFRDVTIHGPGVATLANKIIVKETLQNCEHDAVLGNVKRIEQKDEFELISEHEVQERKGNFIHLKVQWDGNYGHWLVECLPRLILLSQVVPVFDYQIIVSGNGGRIDQVYIDTLSQIGIAREHIFFSYCHNYHFNELIYPGPITIQPWIKSPLVVAALSELRTSVIANTAEKQSNTPRKIFIDRPNTSRRPLINIDKIRDIALSKGFTVVNPSGMSFHQQVRAFAHAEAVVGVLGAECTNIVFSPKGVRLFGLSPEHMQDDFFWDLASLKEGHYVSLHGTSSKSEDGMNSPFEIDAKLFDTLLAQFMEY
ncbi:glycosyltransferase family 61 protein [Methylobacterium sp. ID0610]|uniref:glycosyltransferase family 61 protein n=1 Tax=Methylobacterium carpenticola TaxID=3344827 RepID=UPI0036775294